MLILILFSFSCHGPNSDHLIDSMIVLVSKILANLYRKTKQYVSRKLVVIWTVCNYWDLCSVRLESRWGDVLREKNLPNTVLVLLIL